ncbi:MAG TPA: sulfotransferase [Caulobacteraceae bacterium]|nr:sulfotransferase [Caulobacteraceae bacterium]
MSELNAVQAALARGEYEQAADHAARALSQGERHPTLFNALAFHHSEAGRYQEAIGLLTEGLKLAPRDPHLLYSAGLCLFHQRRDRDALGLFNAALDARPGFAAPLYHRGLIFERAGEVEVAARSYEEAIASEPRYEAPYAGLASLAVAKGDFRRARDYADRALALHPGQTTAHLAIARADFDDGRFEAAVQRLGPILADPGLDPLEKPDLEAALGDALDGLGRVDEAFAAWSEGKRLSRDLYAETQVAAVARRNLDRLAGLKPFVETLPPFPAGADPESTAPGAPRRHLFLVSFPRSGTTLLEQVLASHPDVVTLEERPLLEPAENEFLVSPTSFQRLLDANDDLLDPFRDLYWRQVADHGVAVAGKVFVDKLPLGSVLIPLIARLFPNARFLFAERDPRDVVLSCFRRHFNTNPGMYQFVTLEGTARFYDAVMSVADRYRRLVPDRVHAVRYETLVIDFEGEVRALCAFAGLEWTEALNDFARTARSRTIRTPSAPQVRKGLYTSGAGQWRRYARHMAPVRPVLEPWVESLGYDVDWSEATP